MLWVGSLVVTLGYDCIFTIIKLQSVVKYRGAPKDLRPMTKMARWGAERQGRLDQRPHFNCRRPATVVDHPSVSGKVHPTCYHCSFATSGPVRQRRSERLLTVDLAGGVMPGRVAARQRGVTRWCDATIMNESR